MTAPASWRCCNCGGVHAPHVDTCPVDTLGDVMALPPGVTKIKASVVDETNADEAQPKRRQHLHDALPYIGGGPATFPAGRPLSGIIVRYPGQDEIDPLRPLMQGLRSSG